MEHGRGRAGAVEGELAQVGRRVDCCLQRRALLRYDALDGAGGRQSVSVALLDARIEAWS